MCSLLQCVCRLTVVHVACWFKGCSCCVLVHMLTPCMQDARADTHGQAGRTPLHIACSVGDVCILRLLLDAAPTSHQSVSNTGQTPLMRAAMHGNVAAVEVRGDIGASPLRTPAEPPPVINLFLVQFLSRACADCAVVAATPWWLCFNL